MAPATGSLRDSLYTGEWTWLVLALSLLMLAGALWWVWVLWRKFDDLGTIFRFSFATHYMWASATGQVRAAPSAALGAVAASVGFCASSTVLVLQRNEGLMEGSVPWFEWALVGLAAVGMAVFFVFFGLQHATAWWRWPRALIYPALRDGTRIEVVEEEWHRSMGLEPGWRERSGG